MNEVLEKVFVPSKEGLLKAKQKREKKWEELKQKHYTKDEQLERMNLELEIFESMLLLRKRAVQCINNQQEIIEEKNI